jgi:serine/threonine-protein kinase
MRAGSILSAALEERIRGRVGTTISDKYRLDELLGIGGMASVFASTHRNGSRVAIKLLHPQLTKVRDVRARFLREGYAANKVGHAGVVRVHDDGEDGEGSVFLVMELLEGETLEARWERADKKLPVLDVVMLADQLLEVLEAAHEQGIVHRDIKPENLFLTREGRLKVLDFGIARLLDGTGATRSGELLGTPAFMAPEQAGGRTKDIDARTDIWSVGATMYTLLSGRPVHDHDNVMVQVVHAAGTPARSLATVAPEQPAEIVQLVDTAIAFQQEARWQTARAMRAVLAAARTAWLHAAAPGADRGAWEGDTLPLADGKPVRGSANPTLPLGSLGDPKKA